MKPGDGEPGGSEAGWKPRVKKPSEDEAGRLASLH